MTFQEHAAIHLKNPEFLTACDNQKHRSSVLFVSAARDGRSAKLLMPKESGFHSR
ncbi:hypothetical protein [Variovorax paradoxus]|uniref:hypothetical protein n=1 Tax=Variovorax paradoxus TaxID=34073 RepID=UPI001427CFC8|nr:hypothetical protein [Variovorax paradoxus]